MAQDSEWAEYYFIRYKPCLKRGEVVNIGMIGFFGGDTVIEITQNIDKLKHFDKEITKDDLDNFLEICYNWFVYLKESPETFKFHSLRLSSKGMFKTDLCLFRGRFRDLFKELVG